MIKKMLVGCIAGMALAASALAEITNKSGDFDIGPARDVVTGGFMCKSADTLFKFYEQIPTKEPERHNFIESSVKQHIRSGDCWDVPPSSALFTGIRYADVKRADLKLPSLVFIPRVIIGGRVGFVLPLMLSINLPDIAQLITQKNKERGWPDIQLGTDTTAGSTDDDMANGIDDLIRERTAEGWARPPSARKGMAVVLQINMLQDGTVTSVSVAKSSGDVPFDNSAVKAVKSFSPLSEMDKLKPSDFQPYRSFKMTLTPDDLTL